MTSASAPTPLAAWIAAARPRTLPAAMTPVLVGTALAIADNVFRPLPAAAALLGALLIQIGTNFANDYFDFRKGADTPDRLGPPRATALGWIAPRQMAVATGIAMGLALLVGIYLATVGGWPIVAIGAASILSGILYTGGPLPLAYIGLGDLFVFVFFGLVAVGGTYYVQSLAWPPDHVWYAAASVGCIATAILVVNNLRDRHTDARAGKHTLAVRLGATFTRIEYTALILAAFSMPLIAVLLGRAGYTWLFALAALPFALFTTWRVWRQDGKALNPLLGATAQVGLLAGTLLAFGAMLYPGYYRAYKFFHWNWLYDLHPLWVAWCSVCGLLPLIGGVILHSRERIDAVVPAATGDSHSHRRVADGVVVGIGATAVLLGLQQLVQITNFHAFMADVFVEFSLVVTAAGILLLQLGSLLLATHHLRMRRQMPKLGAALIVVEPDDAPTQRQQQQPIGGAS